jgi:chromate transporter
LIPRIRKSAVAGAFLDGVTVASVALMAVVCWQLGRASIVDAVSGGIAVLSLIALFALRLNTAWLVALGATLGAIVQGLRALP